MAASIVLENSEPSIDVTFFSSDLLAEQFTNVLKEIGKKMFLAYKNLKIFLELYIKIKRDTLKIRCKPM